MGEPINIRLNALNRFTFQQIVCYLVSVVAAAVIIIIIVNQGECPKNAPQHRSIRLILRAYGDPRAIRTGTHTHIYSNRSIYMFSLAFTWRE